MPRSSRILRSRRKGVGNEEGEGRREEKNKEGIMKRRKGGR
jgi:hypothetical protein